MAWPATHSRRNANTAVQHRNLEGYMYLRHSPSCQVSQVQSSLSLHPLQPFESLSSHSQSFSTSQHEAYFRHPCPWPCCLNQRSLVESQDYSHFTRLPLLPYAHPYTYAYTHAFRLKASRTQANFQALPQAVRTHLPSRAPQDMWRRLRKYHQPHNPVSKALTIIQVSEYKAGKNGAHGCWTCCKKTGGYETKRHLGQALDEFAI
jgi:hypothetical protein